MVGVSRNPVKGAKIRLSREGSKPMDLKFDEGMGTTTGDCVGSKNPFTIGGTYAWVPSPFP